MNTEEAEAAESAVNEPGDLKLLRKLEGPRKIRIGDYADWARFELMEEIFRRLVKKRCGSEEF